MTAVTTLEETTTKDLAARALEMGVIQLRDSGVYYGGCSKVANNLKQLIEGLDDDPDFLEQLFLASQQLGSPQEAFFLLEAQWTRENNHGVPLGAYFPDLKTEESREEENCEPETQTIEDDLVNFLASPEGAEVRKGLEADAEAVRSSARKEFLEEGHLSSLEDFIQEHKQPLAAELQRLTEQRDRLQLSRNQYQEALRQMQEHLRKSKGHPHMEAAFRRQIALMDDPGAELARVEAAREAVQNQLAACQAEEAALRASWEEIHSRAAAKIAAHPTIQLLLAVEGALAARRSADLARLLGQIGNQSSQTIVEQANRLDLGAEGGETINTALSSRNWVGKITPSARELAASIAVAKVFDGCKLPDMAQTIILRAENILILNHQNKEIGRIKVWPDGRGRWSKGQPGRPWKVRVGSDCWQLESAIPHPH